MQKGLSAPARAALAGGVFLAIFSLIFSVGSAVGAWPSPPPGGFRGVDLAAGFTFGIVLLVSFLARRLASSS